MSQIKVSVIILCYNQADSIERAVRSVACQDCSFPFEILLTDDCSSDGTDDVCQRLAAEYPDLISYHRNSPNLGIQANYFSTLQRCRGEYVADCAGDDFWISNHRLQHLVDAIEACPEASMVHSGWTDIMPSGEKRSHPMPPLIRPVNLRGELVAPLLKHEISPLIHLSTALYRRQILMEEYHKDPDIFLNPAYGCEDLQILVLMAAKGNVVYLPEVTLGYVIGDTLSKPKNPAKAFRFFKGTIELTMRLAEITGYDPRKLRGFLSSRCNYLISLAWAMKSPERMREAMEISGKYGIRPSAKSMIKKLMLQTFVREEKNS